MPLSSAIHAHAAGMVGQLEGLAEIHAAHIVLIQNDTAKPADRFSVKVHIAVRGPDVHAEESAETIYAAMDLVGDKLARQLRKRKTKLTERPRRSIQRVREQVKGATT